MRHRQIKNVLISVFNKKNLSNIVIRLHKLNVNIYSTGGTEEFIKNLHIPVKKVEDLTSYPSILGGRVKTLHPKIFGGILARRDLEIDNNEIEKYKIPEFDLVIVDLYPFEKTLKNSKSENEIIEKIDIGGISLIRAAAKNFKDVLVISHVDQYDDLIDILKRNSTTLKTRRLFAAQAFNISSHYDTTIFNYFKTDELLLKESVLEYKKLRYGENPHQKGIFFGNINEIFDQLHGKELSYNNLLDIDSALNIINEFDDPTFAILKHTNTCGIASRDNLTEAWECALSGDPISAFGGVLITNTKINIKTANKINDIFFEVLIAPSYADKAINILKQKKNRILLLQKNNPEKITETRSIINGTLYQEKNLKTDDKDNMEIVTNHKPNSKDLIDLIFASKICKHSKSNAIVFAKDKQLLASGVGQTSRIDALNQAIKKAKRFGFNLKNAVMASDAFFPFADCVEAAYKAGITHVIQPGGSIRDNLSIDYCNKHDICMIMTGTRHFKH
ncbi:MAG: bifunctional phosphoribosylaminoimidazolecarboxamide formyltransferase/IMP cyclohydrolase [Bacteroidota bacterium]|nr:bifunctional phosphoribosylaminoimidazolecarboxamide formyltransferase/IMP cyclohydrolase [Bacteroidota bacterium]